MFCVLVYALCFLSFAGHHWEESGSNFFMHSYQVFIDISMLSPLQTAQSHLSHHLLICQMPQSLHHLWGSLLNSLQYVYVSHGLGNPELDTALQMSLNVAEHMGMITVFDLLAMLLRWWEVAETNFFMGRVHKSNPKLVCKESEIICINVPQDMPSVMSHTICDEYTSKGNLCLFK